MKDIPPPNVPTAVCLPLFYLPPVQYFAHLAGTETLLLERHETYQKGSYRNRCHLAGPNGLLRLTVPLKKGKNEGQPITEVRIAYDEPWPAQHWQTIRSAYGRAPFFDHYAYRLEPLFDRRPECLFAWNLELLEVLLSCLGWSGRLTFTVDYQAALPAHIPDLRNLIHPKAHRAGPDDRFRPYAYPQLFRERHGFLPNLSILDLLFCTGPEAWSYLERSLIEPV